MSLANWIVLRYSELIGANDVLDALVWRRFVLGADEGA